MSDIRIVIQSQPGDDKTGRRTLLIFCVTVGVIFIGTVAIVAAYVLFNRHPEIFVAPSSPGSNPIISPSIPTPITSPATGASTTMPVNPLDSLVRSAIHFYSFDRGTLDWRQSPALAKDVIDSRPSAIIHNVTAISTGRINGALRFSSSDRYIEILGSGTENPNDAYSLVAWVWLDAAGDGTIIDKSDWAHRSTAGYSFRVWKGTPVLTVGANSQWHTLSSATSLPIGRWTHVAAVNNGLLGQIYIDGRLEAEKALPKMNPSVYPTRIGNGTFEKARDRALPGMLDEVGIFHRALREVEVRNLADRKT